MSALAGTTTIKCEASGASATRSPTVPAWTIVSFDRLRPKMARLFSCCGSIVDGSIVKSAGAVGDDGSGLVRVLPAGNVPGAGRAVGPGDDLADGFGVGFGFGLAVAEAVGDGEAVGEGEGLAASAGDARSKANASRPRTTRLCQRQAMPV